MQIEQPDFIHTVFLILTLRLERAQNFVSINYKFAHTEMPHQVTTELKQKIQKNQ